MRRKYRELLCKHLGQFLDRLLAEFTGLHFHISWAPVAPHPWDTRTLPTACSLCSRLSGLPLQRVCRICGPKQLARALDTDGNGLLFTCRLGVLNYWYPIRIRDETLGIAYLQALKAPAPKQSTRTSSARSGPSRPRRPRAPMMSRMEFARATRLLQFIVQHAQTASLSDLRKAELTNAGKVVLALEKEQARLHEALQRHLPAASAAPRRSGSESHADQVVHRLLECIERDYRKPLTLRQCAARLQMNRTYLSALFSRRVGVPFKTYLTEMRLAKAKALLCDPGKTASDVAYAVGYPNENRLRLAFRRATGLPPKLWRETMQMNPPPPSP